MVFLAWACAGSFYLSQNTYFGWNASPKSDAELIADGITLLLLSLAALATITARQ